MILPPIEGERHGAEVIDTFFFDGSTGVLRAGERRGAVARERGLARAWGRLAPIGVVAGVTIDCFPNRYAARAGARGAIARPRSSTRVSHTNMAELA